MGRWHGNSHVKSFTERVYDFLCVYSYNYYRNKLHRFWTFVWSLRIYPFVSHFKSILPDDVAWVLFTWSTCTLLYLSSFTIIVIRLPSISNYDKYVYLFYIIFTTIHNIQLYAYVFFILNTLHLTLVFVRLSDWNFPLIDYVILYFSSVQTWLLLYHYCVTMSTSSI